MLKSDFMVGYPKGLATTPRNQDEEWFATDIGQATESAGEARMVRIYYITADAVDVEYTLNSGASWEVLETSVANTYRAPVYIPIRNADLFNMRHGTAATDTAVICRVDIVTEGD